jgi:predicted Zn-dependent peptidase
LILPNFTQKLLGINLEYNDVLAAITLQQLQQAANRFFDESNIGTFILLPEHQ